MKIKEAAIVELQCLEKIKKNLGEPVRPDNYGVIDIRQKKGVMYYAKVDLSGKHYISKDNEKILKDNMQYSYDMDVKRVIERKIKALTNFIKAYDDREIASIYSKLHEGRKPYVTPIVESDEEYLERWMNKKCIPNSYEFKSEIYSNKGEHVRSKSEKIIADWLYAHDIPYRYEKDLRLKNGEMVHPDFTILCLKNRKEIYWEHLGKMDDPGYAEKNVRKVEKYERNQIIPGKNLILTFETSETVLDARLIPELLLPYLE